MRNKSLLPEVVLTNSERWLGKGIKGNLCKILQGQYRKVYAFDEEPSLRVILMKIFYLILEVDNRATLLD